jgi:hypothetical protein
VTQRLAWPGLRLRLRVRIAFLFVQACTCKDCARQDLKPMQQCSQSTVKLTDVYWSCKLVIVSVFVWPVEPAACTSHGFAIAFCVASRARRVHVLRICNCVLRGESSAHLLCGFDDKQMMSNLCSQGSQGPGDQGSRVVHLPAARSAHIFRFLPPTQCSQDCKSLFRCLAFLFGHFGKWKPWHSPIMTPMFQR